MKRLLPFALPLFLLACDDNGTKKPDASLPDAAAPDAAPDATIMIDAAPALGVGELCPNGTECKTGLLCLNSVLDARLPTDGLCTKTCSADADCGGDSFCAPPLGDGPQFCFQKCTTDAAACAGAPERICAQRLMGMLDLGQVACVPGDPTKKDGDACAGRLGDCNVNQACMINPFDMPTGMCLTFGCTPGDATTCAPGGDGQCIMAGNNNVCVDPCTTDTDCRTAEGHVCGTLPGLPFKICIFPARHVGSECAEDLDCGPAGTPWKCLTDDAFPGGYCSGELGTCDPTNEVTCPQDSVCIDPTSDMMDNADDYCVALCQSDMDCRATYACLPLDPANAMSPKGCLAQ